VARITASLEDAQKIFGLGSKLAQGLELNIDAGRCRPLYTNHRCEEGAKEAVTNESARDLFPNSRIVINFPPSSSSPLLKTSL
jgi:hypothetical protein